MNPREVNEWVKKYDYEQYKDEHVDDIAFNVELRQIEFVSIMRERKRKNKKNGRSPSPRRTI